jgi:predicted DNA-binding transcriptional regulator YafY
MERRVARILRILHLIAAEPQQWPRAKLAAHFRVSERGIDRDIEVLRGIGYQITRTAQGYELSGPEPVPPPPEP